MQEKRNAKTRAKKATPGIIERHSRECAISKEATAARKEARARRVVRCNCKPSYRGWVYGIGYGAQLGLGFTTIVTASITWVALACAAATGSVAAGMVVGATFGLARALPVLATARAHDPSTLRARLARLDRLRPQTARVATVLQVTLAVAVLGVVAVQFA